MTDAHIHRQINNRLIRIESKLVRGFEELCVNIDADQDWLRVDDVRRQVHVQTIGRSLTVMLSDMAKGGATQVGKEYDIYHNGAYTGSIVFKGLV